MKTTLFFLETKNPNSKKKASKLPRNTDRSKKPKRTSGQQSESPYWLTNPGAAHSSFRINCNLAQKKLFLSIFFTDDFHYYRMRNLRRLHISPRIFNRPIRSAGKRSSRTEKPTESVPEQKYTLSENQKYCFQTFATTAVAVAVIWLESVKFCFFIWSGRFLVLFRTHFYCEFFLLALTRQFR